MPIWRNYCPTWRQVGLTLARPQRWYMIGVWKTAQRSDSWGLRGTGWSGLSLKWAVTQTAGTHTLHNCDRHKLSGESVGGWVTTWWGGLPIWTGISCAFTPLCSFKLALGARRILRAHVLFASTQNDFCPIRDRPTNRNRLAYMRGDEYDDNHSRQQTRLPLKTGRYDFTLSFCWEERYMFFFAQCWFTRCVAMIGWRPIWVQRHFGLCPWWHPLKIEKERRRSRLMACAICLAMPAYLYTES